MLRSFKKPLAGLGIAAGSFGLAFGIGMAVSQAATTSSSGSTTTTVPAGAAHPCPNMSSAGTSAS